VLRFSGQQLDIGDVKRFSELFGEIQGNPIRAVDVTKPFPEVGELSNIKENGAYIGSPDAGQDWHTDMSYRETIGFVTVLYGIRIPWRDGKLLVATSSQTCIRLTTRYRKRSRRGWMA
jgi:taurine dioxygenase